MAAGLPSPPLDLFCGGLCSAIFCRSCTRLVDEVERPSATLYSTVQPSAPGFSLPRRMCSAVRRLMLFVSPM